MTDLTAIAQNQQESEFLELCQKHDLTYNYSDDASVWRRGEESYKKIKAAAQAMPRERAMAIWNAVVDSKISSQHAEQFKWR